MNRLFKLAAGMFLSIFLVAAVHAAPDNEAAGTKPDPKGNKAVKSYYEKEKQRSANKKRAQKARQQQIDRDNGSRTQQPAK